VTTQSPHLYTRQSRPAAAKTKPATGSVQTTLPWWAVALPVLAFAALLVLIAGGGSDASAAGSSGDLLGRVALAVPHLLQHVM
jgi:hypothetical protein